MIDDEDIDLPQLFLLPYGGQPPHVRGSDTSKAAAESVRGITGRLRLAVAKAIAGSRSVGMTCDEVEVKLGIIHQTASPRFVELKAMEWIVDSGKRRRTRRRRSAVVYVVAPAVRERFGIPRVADEDLL